MFRMAARAAEVESPTGPTGSGRAASPLSSPRQAASLAVITEVIKDFVIIVCLFAVIKDFS